MKYINFAAADAQYYATITFDDTNYGGMKCVSLDCINDITVNSQSQITQFPLVSGKISADHTIQQPRTVTISGKFGRNASYSGTNKTIEETFKNIQRLFERIKNQGYLCTIQKVHRETTDFETFDELKNMVLTSISWIEQNNTMNFNFTFTEVLLVDVVKAPYEETDENAPTYSDLINTSLNQNFYGAGVLKTIYDVSDELINTLEYSQAVATQAGEGMTLIGAVGSGILGGAAFGPVGLLFGPAVAIAGYIITDTQAESTEAITNEARENLEKFKNDPKKSAALSALMQDVYKRMPTYMFPQDGDQVAYMTVDNVGIRIEVKVNRGGSANSASVSIYDYSSGALLGQKNNIFLSSWMFEECTPIATINDYGIYAILLRPSQTDENNVTEMIKEAQKGDLTRYGLIVTDIKPEQYRAWIASRINEVLGLGL